MRVYLGSDHAGFERKNAIVQHLKVTGHQVIDCGANAYDALDDYPAFCIETARRVVADPGSLGVVVNTQLIGVGGISVVSTSCPSSKRPELQRY